MGFLDDIKLPGAYKSENLTFKVKGTKNQTYRVAMHVNDQCRGPESLAYDIFRKGKQDPIAMYEMWFQTKPAEQWIQVSKFINWTSEQTGAKPAIGEEEAKIIIKRILERIGFRAHQKIPISFCECPQQIYGGSKLLRLKLGVDKTASR